MRKTKDDENSSSLTANGHYAEEYRNNTVMHNPYAEEYQKNTVSQIFFWENFAPLQWRSQKYLSTEATDRAAKILLINIYN